MPIYLRDIVLSLDETEDLLRDKIARRLKLPPAGIRCFAAVRRSLDARKRDRLQFVYCVEAALDDTAAERRAVQRLHRQDVVMLTDRPGVDPTPASTPLRHRPVIVGFGPAGMFAAWRLACFGYRPLILERGRDVRTRHRDVIQRFYRQRIFDPESNLLFGEGGAGAYSDGKLYTRINDPHTPLVLQVLYEHGAAPEILSDGKPHIGSDRLPNICMRLRKHLESLGAEVRFATRLDDLLLDEDRRVRGLRTADQVVPADCAILAIGHSARDTVTMLSQRGVPIVAKPFQLGVRIEHFQDQVDRWQYGRHAGHDRLPPADYHLVAKGAAGAGADLFSFCMCPGGIILPTHESPGLIVTNGASRASRGGPFANSGLVITIPTERFGDDPLRGLAYQRQWEAGAFAATAGGYAVPAQRACDYLQGRPSDGTLNTSYPLGGQWADIARLIPREVDAALKRALGLLDQRLPGFAGDQALVTAPETRASAPVRIPRDPQTRESTAVGGLYPVGEGAGYAGGIISAAIDGLKTADRIISRFGPAAE